MEASIVEKRDVAAVAKFMVTCFGGSVGDAEDFLLSVMNKLSIDRSEEKLASKAAAKTANTRRHVPVSNNVSMFNDEIDSAISTLVLKVPGKPHIIGHVIGKGGSEISKIEAETGSTVKIDSQSKMLPGSSERRVCIIGTVSGNMLAQQLVSNKIAEKLMMEEVIHDSLKMIVPDKAIRHIIGKGGASIQQLEADSGAQIQIDPESAMLPTDVGRCINIQGDDKARSLAQYLISRQVAQDETIDADWASNDASGGGRHSSASSPNSMTPPSPTYGNHHHHHHHHPHHNHNQGKLNGGKGKNVESVTITVPNASVAYLIGRGGAAISDMQKQSRARINIAKQSAHAEMTKRRQVTISGTGQAIQLAQMIIARKLQQYEQGSKSSNSAPSSPTGHHSNVGSAPHREYPQSPSISTITTTSSTYSDARTDGGDWEFPGLVGPWVTDQFSFNQHPQEHSQGTPHLQQPPMSSPWSFGTISSTLH